MAVIEPPPHPHAQVWIWRAVRQRIHRFKPLEYWYAVCFIQQTCWCFDLKHDKENTTWFLLQCKHNLTNSTCFTFSSRPIIYCIRSMCASHHYVIAPKFVPENLIVSTSHASMNNTFVCSTTAYDGIKGLCVSTCILYVVNCRKHESMAICSQSYI